MNLRRITLTLGAAAGGLLAVALADDASTDTFTTAPDPGTPLPNVSGQFGDPPFFQGHSGISKLRRYRHHSKQPGGVLHH
jgi:hypothetical protein